MTPTMNDLLVTLSQSPASDLHLSAGSPPSYRLHGRLEPANNAVPLSASEVQHLVFELLNQAQLGQLQETGELDFSMGFANIGRFRCNVHRHRGTWAAAFRKIPAEIPSFNALGLPEIARTLALRESGLVLVTGPTGSGKSMTLAAMIETINETRPCHIITVEDPIEFVFKNKMAMIKQREIGTDTKDYTTALHHIFRQDPDVVMLGEIRDQETLATALTSAGTGRLVLGTLHTMDAASTVNRMIESFPPEQQSLMQNQIAGCLEGIVSQQLLRRADGKGRILATEVMITTPSIRNLIRSGKSFQILNDIEVGKRFGMQTMNQTLQELIVKGEVKLEEALRHTRQPESLLQRMGVPQ